MERAFYWTRMGCRGLIHLSKSKVKTRSKTGSNKKIPQTNRMIKPFAWGIFLVPVVGLEPKLMILKY